MDTFEEIARRVARLPRDRNDVIAATIAYAFDGDLNPPSMLSAQQQTVVRQRMAEPFDYELATDDEVERAFANLSS